MQKILEIEGKFPSINTKYKLNRITGRLFLSKEYREFKELIAFSTHKTLIEPPYHIVIEITTYKDIDACIKPILDGLERNVIENDKDIIKLTIVKKPVKKNSIEYLRVLGESLK